MIREVHRWAPLHVFLREMIRDPEFVCRADDIVVNSEIRGCRAWRIVTLRAETDAELQSLWRETSVPLTWNSRVYRQFYETVHEINQKHPCSHPVRIILADPPLDWSKIKTARDYAPWTDREASYANVVEREVLAKHHRALLNPHKKWPPMAEVLDGVLNVGGQTLVYPSPAIYLEAGYHAELRRRAAIIKESSGQDFTPTIDQLVKEAQKQTP